MENSDSAIVQLIFLVIFVIGFFLPTIIARRKNHPNKTGIMLVNVIGGLFAGVGWVIALVWSFITPKQFVVSPADELKKLHDLKEKGVITEKEFNKKKDELL